MAACLSAPISREEKQQLAANRAIDREMEGLEQRIAVGPMAGRSNAAFVLERLGIDPTEEVVARVLDAGKSSKRLLTDDEVRAAAGA